MARIDNLNNFLTDVANAIRNKKGTNTSIPAANFDTEIASIETGGSGEASYYPLIKVGEITYNGSVNLGKSTLPNVTVPEIVNVVVEFSILT